MANLPEEIIEEIFLKLPTKSIGKCRCLSKTWNANLSTCQFINLHLKTRKTRQQNIIGLSHFSIHLVSSPMKNDFNFSDEIIELGASKWTGVYGSCNGLVLLLQAKPCNMFVVNPITRKQVRIPTFSRKDGLLKIFGFGYDRSCHDYKVVKLTFRLGYDENVHCYVDVYSMKTRVWKTIDCPVKHDFHRLTRAMAFVHGAVHWYSTVDRICGFDLASESFHEILLPKVFHQTSSHDGPVIFHGCLAITNYCFDGSVDLWVMREYGVGDSWVRFRIPRSISRGCEFAPLCFVGDGEMFCTGSGCWVMYDVNERTRKDVGRFLPIKEWMVFEESLVSPYQDSVSN